MTTHRGTLQLVIEAAIKLDARTDEWENVLAFIQSCYAGRVRTFDFYRATAALARLEEEEQHALITWGLLLDEVETRGRM